MKIRRAEATDAAALASIRHDAILALTKPATSSDQAEQWANRIAPDRIARALQEHDVWVACEDVAIGWIETDHDRIAALYVSSNVARRGIGSALLRVAETSILAAGHEVARLVASQNALDFYRRRGYVHCGAPDADGAWPLSKQLVTETSERSELSCAR